MLYGVEDAHVLHRRSLWPGLPQTRDFGVRLTGFVLDIPSSHRRKHLHYGPHRMCRPTTPEVSATDSFGFEKAAFPKNIHANIFIFIGIRRTMFDPPRGELSSLLSVPHGYGGPRSAERKGSHSKDRRECASFPNPCLMTFSRLLG